MQTVLLETKDSENKKKVQSSIDDLKKALKLLDQGLKTVQKEDVQKALLSSLAALKKGKAIKRDIKTGAKSKKQKKAKDSEEEEESD